MQADAALDDLLSRWHHWQLPDTVGKGFNARSAVAGDFRVSRQHDDTNGALYDDEENDRMRVVDFAVRQMDPEHAAALHQVARALMLGIDVFRSPRLPSDPAERAKLVDAARVVLIARLIAAGLL